MRSLLTVVLALAAALSALATDTTRRNLNSPRDDTGRELATIDCGADSVDTDGERALVLSGFRKRASDTRESFVVRNNTPHHITQATLTLRYTEADGGQVIAEQTVTLQLDLPPGGSQRVTVGSFDTQKRYHYAYGSKPRLKSTPFDVAVRILSYDKSVRVRVER